MVRRVVTAILSCLVVVGVAFAQPTTIGRGWAPNELRTQPMDYWNCNAITFTTADSIWNVRDHNGAIKVCVGFDIEDTCTGGTLVFHLYNSPAALLCTLKVPDISASKQPYTRGFIIDKFVRIGSSRNVLAALRIWL